MEKYRKRHLIVLIEWQTLCADTTGCEQVIRESGAICEQSSTYLIQLLQLFNLLVGLAMTAKSVTL